jgi:hypothetical protein
VASDGEVTVPKGSLSISGGATVVAGGLTVAGATSVSVGMSITSSLTTGTVLDVHATDTGAYAGNVLSISSSTAGTASWNLLKLSASASTPFRVCSVVLMQVRPLFQFFFVL